MTAITSVVAPTFSLAPPPGHYSNLSLIKCTIHSSTSTRSTHFIHPYLTKITSLANLLKNRTNFHKTFGGLLPDVFLVDLPLALSWFVHPWYIFLFLIILNVCFCFLIYLSVASRFACCWCCKACLRLLIFYYFNLTYRFTICSNYSVRCLRIKPITFCGKDFFHLIPRQFRAVMVLPRHDYNRVKVTFLSPWVWIKSISNAHIILMITPFLRQQLLQLFDMLCIAFNISLSFVTYVRFSSI